MELLLFGLLLPWLLLAVCGWLVFQLMQQNGRMLLRLEAIEHKLAAAPAAPAPVPELPVGEPAPDFVLPDLEGNRHSLADYRGRKTLVVFFSPQCGFCLEMLPELAELASDGSAGRPALLIISNGEAVQNRQLFAEAGIQSTILLQNEMEVAARYRIQGTPMGYLIDERGGIASQRAGGSIALCALGAPPGTGGRGQKAGRGKANKGLAHSRIRREGLEPGTPAPNFKLPTLAADDLELTQLRGQPVLLVFSDPECGPCAQVAARLEQLHRQRRDFQVVMVSRRDPELNRQKVRELGLTFPVALQKQWEVSRLYALFLTPVGYWIDAAGVVGKKAAVGLEAILALVETPMTANGKP